MSFKAIDMIPVFMRQFAEMRAIMNETDKQADAIEKYTKKVFNGAFIDLCDEDGIERYENIMGIKSDKSESLELRRERIKSKWYQDIPYTYRYIIHKISTYCKTDIDKYDSEHYQLNISTYAEIKGMNEDIDALLENKLPLNIQYLHINKLPVSDSLNETVGGCVSFSNVIKNTDQNTYHFVTNDNMYETAVAGITDLIKNTDQNTYHFVTNDNMYETAVAGITDLIKNTDQNTFTVRTQMNASIAAVIGSTETIYNNDTSQSLYNIELKMTDGGVTGYTEIIKIKGGNK